MTFFGFSALPDRPVSPSNKKGSILLVDDDPVILEMVGGRLTLEQYMVFPSPSAEKALETLKRVTPDLIILDIAMPGLGGLGFLKRLAAATPHATCPVIIFSGRHELESFFKDMPVAAFIPKTTLPEVFIQKVEAVIQSARLPPANTAAPAKKRLMLIEDDRTIAHHLELYFSKLGGYSVHGHDGGHSFLDEVTRILPDLVLIKYLLPSHNGTALAQALASHPPTRGIPVILYDDSEMHSTLPMLPNVKRLIPSGRDNVLLTAIHHIVNNS